MKKISFDAEHYHSFKEHLLKEYEDNPAGFACMANDELADSFAEALKQTYPHLVYLKRGFGQYFALNKKALQHIINLFEERNEKMRNEVMLNEQLIERAYANMINLTEI